MQEIIQFINHHPVLSILWTGLMVILLCTVFKDLTSKAKTISHDEATYLINKENAIVLDIRHRDDFSKGYIAGSINLLPKEIKYNDASELKKHKSKPIIIVDDTDMYTQDPVNALIKAGFKHVYVLKEGISGWKNKNLPLIRGK